MSAQRQPETDGRPPRARGGNHAYRVERLETNMTLTIRSFRPTWEEADTEAKGLTAQEEGARHTVTAISIEELTSFANDLLWEKRGSR